MSTSAIVKQFHYDVSKGSVANAAAELSNAKAMLDLNRVLSAAGAKIGTTHAYQIQPANTITYQVGGKFFSLAAADGLWTPGTASSNLPGQTGSATTVAINSWQKYLLLLTPTGLTTGTGIVLEGVQSSVSAAAVGWSNIASGTWGPLIQALNVNNAAIISVATVATTTNTFVPGTTSFAGTGITTTYADGIDASLLQLMGLELGQIIGSF
jgi:hypothetical protein